MYKCFNYSTIFIHLFTYLFICLFINSFIHLLLGNTPCESYSKTFMFCYEELIDNNICEGYNITKLTLNLYIF